MITSTEGMRLSAQLLAEILGPGVEELNQPSGIHREVTRVAFPIESRMMPMRQGKFSDALVVQVRDLSPKGIAIESSLIVREGERFVVAVPKIKGNRVWIQCTAVRYQIIAANLYVIGATFDRLLELNRQHAQPAAAPLPIPSADQDIDAIRRAILS